VVQMHPQKERIEVKGKLLVVYIRPEITSLDGRPGDALHAVEPHLLLLEQHSPHLSWAVAEIAAGGNKDASARKRRAPPNPVSDQGFDPRDAGLRPEGGSHHVFPKQLGRVVEYFDLELFLGLEMGEQPTLGQMRGLGKGADGHALQAQTTGHIQAGFENNRFGIFASGHTQQNSTTVRTCQE